MSFYFDLAEVLDQADIAARVQDDVLYVPINPNLEMQFVVIDEDLPAANVYIAEALDFEEFPETADAPAPWQEDSADHTEVALESDEDFTTTLVAVVFTVADAVEKVEEILATEQNVAVLESLLIGDDPRLEGLDFYQDLAEPFLARADIAQHSQIQVLLQTVAGQACAEVEFLATSAAVAAEAWEELDADDPAVEVLSLGNFQDMDALFDALALATRMGESWEGQLAPVR